MFFHDNSRTIVSGTTREPSTASSSKATLLAYGKSASKGARPGSCAERLGVGASFCMQVTVARTRGTARVGCAPSPPGFSSRRRGYGGRRLHPLKDHRPLRIPFAAAFSPKFRALPPTHKDGRLLSLSLPSSPGPSSPSLNATKRPRPLSVGRGRVAHSR